MSILSKIRGSDNLGHPLCDNLRNGDWMPQYMANRLKAHSRTKKVSFISASTWFSVYK